MEGGSSSCRGWPLPPRTGNRGPELGPTRLDETEGGDRMGAPVVHFEINRQALQAPPAYYSQLCGWQVQEAMPTYGLVHTEAGGKGIEGGISGESENPGVTIYAGVADPRKHLDVRGSL